MRTSDYNGFPVDQSVLLAVRDQPGIARLVQYMTQISVSLARLVEMSDTWKVVCKEENPG